MTDSLIPSNNSPLQHALAKLSSHDVEELDWRVIARSKDPYTADAKWLPWLAWENSIGYAEGWQFAENDEARRHLIANYIQKHTGKGTPAIIRELMRNLQLGEVEIIEHTSGLRWDGTGNFDGKYYFGGSADDWAKWAMIVRRPITNTQAATLKKILNRIAPARCQLMYIDYRSDALKWDGEISFNGQYNFGALT